MQLCCVQQRLYFQMVCAASQPMRYSHDSPLHDFGFGRVHLLERAIAVQYLRPDNVGFKPWDANVPAKIEL